MEEVFFNGQKRVIKKEDDKTFLIEGDSIYLKWSINDPPSSVEFHKGPRLLVGKDFFGKGTIQAIQPVATGIGKKSIRVTIGTPPKSENLDFFEERFSRRF